MKTFLIISSARWDSKYSSTALSFSKELAKNNRVLLVDNPFTWKDFFSLKNKNQIRKRLGALLFGVNSLKMVVKGCDNLMVVVPRLVFPINRINNLRVYSFLLKFNNRQVNKAVRKALVKLAPNNYITINIFNPFYRCRLSVNSLSSKKYIYYVVDNINAANYYQKHGPRLEIECLKESDLVCATSLKLKAYAGKYNHNVLHLPNAVDFYLFNNCKLTTKPQELKNLKSKVVGYIGNLDDRLDYTLLNKILLRFDNLSLLLVGPINTNSTTLNNLLNNPKVIYTGSKKIEEVPVYLNQLDCALIPFLDNEFTKYIYPLKVNEYLSVGLPIVSTSFSPDIQLFKDIIYLASNESDFLEHINRALNEDKKHFYKERVSYAHNNTWMNRVGTFLDTIGTSEAEVNFF